jgi:predicted CoA-binding protein
MDEAHDTIGQILDGTRTIAVMGLSPSPNRPSHGVAAYLQRQGYRVIPVNPDAVPDEILGETVYPELASVPESIDLVHIFRRSEFVGPIVEQAVQIGAKYLWMQDGVVDADAAQVARSAGLLVVMNDCLFRQHRSRSVA